MTTPTESELDIHNYFHERRLVAIIWCTEDVQGRRPDLTDDQAWEVLKRCERGHDCNYGVTWDLIDWVAEEMFPRPDLPEK
jgi:hypothetical protein